jgi:hypothetical protein
MAGRRGAARRVAELAEDVQAQFRLVRSLDRARALAAAKAARSVRLCTLATMACRSSGSRAAAAR